MGRVHVRNDLDLEIVTKENVLGCLVMSGRAARMIDRLERSFGAWVATKQIDCGVSPTSVYNASATITMSRFDTVSGSVVLAGDACAKPSTSWQPEGIPLSEGARLLQNRGAGLLIPCVYSMVGAVDELTSSRGALEIGKAIVACGDLYLLREGNYASRYSTRCERVLGSREGRRWVSNADLYERAAKCQLGQETLEDPISMADLKVSVDMLLRVWRHYEAERLGVKIRSWEDYLRVVGDEPLRRTPERIAVMLRAPDRLALVGRAKMSLASKLRFRYDAALLGAIPLLLREWRCQAKDHPGTPGKANDLLRRIGRLLAAWHPGGEAARAASMARNRFRSY